MVSRVARSPISVPTGVNISLVGQELAVKGKLGELTRNIHSQVKIEQVDNELRFSPVNNSSHANALAGTMRALANNMVIGVSEGFSKKLVLIGVGYRAKVQGNQLNLTVGYSHPVDFILPAGISAEVPSQTEIIIKGSDNHLVGQVAANIRRVRPPEPYKGKGIRYANEKIILKEGKKKK